MKSLFQVSSFGLALVALTALAPAAAYEVKSCSVNTSTTSCSTVKKSVAPGKDMYTTVGVSGGYGQVSYRMYRGTTIVWQGATDANAAKYLKNTTTASHQYYGRLLNFNGLSGASATIRVTYY